MKNNDTIEKAEAWFNTIIENHYKGAVDLQVKYFKGTIVLSDEQILHIYLSENKESINTVVEEVVEIEVCFQQCESCREKFDIETMIEGEQWFCEPCWDELSKNDEFMGRESQSSVKVETSQSIEQSEVVSNPAFCLDCNKSYSTFGLDIIFERSEWLKIHPDENGVICANCIAVRAGKLKDVICIKAILDMRENYIDSDVHDTNVTNTQPSTVQSESVEEHIDELIIGTWVNRLSIKEATLLRKKYYPNAQIRHLSLYHWIQIYKSEGVKSNASLQEENTKLREAVKQP